MFVYVCMTLPPSSLHVSIYLFQSLGNHEFDNGVAGLIPFIQNVTCPVLASNLILTKEPKLQAEPNLMNSVVIDINGTKIGIIGYLTPDTKFIATKNDVEYINEVVAVGKEATMLKNNGVNILIALGHSGFLMDLEIAKRVEDIDLVIGGHTNTFLYSGKAPDVEVAEGMYPTIVVQDSGRLVPVVQAYAYTKYLGHLYLNFDKNGEMSNYEGSPLLLNDSVPHDPAVLKIVNQYREDIQKLTEKVIGITSVIVDGESCRSKECSMGNVITDAMIHKYASEYSGVGWTDAPVAIVHGGGIRSSFHYLKLPSNITRGDVLRVMPFDGTVIKVELAGSDLRKVLEHSVHRYNALFPTGEFLQMSGMKVVYDLKKPSHQRVKSVHVRCGECTRPIYEVLNKTKEYKILMPAFLASGGDGYDMFTELPQVSLHLSEIECTETYITSHSPLYPAIEGRIVIKHQDQNNETSNLRGKMLS